MTKTIQTNCGEIRGTGCQWQGVTAYRGIRYATAGRWEYPKPVTHWEGVYDATQYGPCCYQPRAFYDEAAVPEKAFYYHEFREGETYAYSEDCLFLNIWAPDSATPESKLPVIFYIHGGGFTGGCGHEKHFDGPVWPTKGVIAVTCNYRLGPLGFACLPELEAEAGHTGNYGLFDQITALEWVHKNIQAFGGDPSNITIMGQSAGAMSVQSLCVSPLTDGLFTKAVMNSGGGVSKLMDFSDRPESRFPFWQKVMEAANCAGLEALRALEPEALFSAWDKVKKTDRKYAMAASPCVDGRLLTASALAAAKAGQQKNIPYLMGSTSQDVVPPIVHGMAKDWCVLQAKQNKQPSYCWFFDRRLPGDDNGAWHSSELWYFFGTLGNGWRPFTDWDYRLSDAMAEALCNFARSGDPNGSGLPRWEPTTVSRKQVMCWGEDAPHMGNPGVWRLIHTMLTNRAVGE